MSDKKRNILIVGAGKGGTALIEVFKESKNINIAGVVDINLEAQGIKLAGQSGIPAGSNYKEFIDKVEEVINVTGSDTLQEELVKAVPVHIEVIGGHSAKLFWDIIEEVKKAKEYAELIFKVTPSAIFTVDTNRIVTSWNRRAEEITGYAAEEMVGKDCSIFADYSCKDKCGFFSKNLDKQVFARECKIRCKNGYLRTVLKNADFLRDEKGSILGGIESFEDITERKKAEEFKDEIISVVSHELRTPLTAIRESIAQIVEGILGEVPEKQKNFLSIGLKNADRLRRIIDNFLDISKLEAGRIRLKREKVDITQLVRELLPFFTLQLEEKHLEIRCNFPPQPIVAYIDHDKIIQVIINLVGNSFRFTEKGYIEITALDKDNHVEISVLDTGKGIDQYDLPKAFTKFQQFSRTHGCGDKGVGLGLSIAKAIVELHGGKIWMESKVDEGTKVTFILPKYSEREVLLESIRNKINFAQREYSDFTIFLIRVDNYDEIKGKLGEKTEDLFKELLSSLERAVKSWDPVMRLGERELFLIVDAGRHSEPNVDTAAASLKKGVKEAVFKVQEDITINFSYGYSIYPENTENAPDLLEAAVESFRSEAQERLNKRILLVDDEEAITKALKRILENIGYTNIGAVNNGQAALEEVTNVKPDLMILDMKMPGMSGYEVIGHLKENLETKDIPVLIVSGYRVEVEKLGDYVEKKAILTISKPFGITEISKTVYYLL